MIELLDRMDAGAAPRTTGCRATPTGSPTPPSLPYVLRLDHLGMAPLLSAPARPRLADWYDRVRARPSFETAVARVGAGAGGRVPARHR